MIVIVSIVTPPLAMNFFVTLFLSVGMYIGQVQYTASTRVFIVILTKM
jgi:hypothetical protein